MAVKKFYVIEVTQYSNINTPISTFEYPYENEPTENDIENRIVQVGFMHGYYTTTAEVKPKYRLAEETILH